MSLSHIRFTRGVMASGKTFEFHDDWTRPENRHKVLEEDWIGYSVFAERQMKLADFQQDRLDDHVKMDEKWKVSRWSEE